MLVNVRTPAKGTEVPSGLRMVRLAFGDVKFEWLRALNISIRSCALNDSEIFAMGMFLNSDKSKAISPGPINELRPESPSRLLGLGVVKH